MSQNYKFITKKFFTEPTHIYVFYVAGKTILMDERATKASLNSFPKSIRVRTELCSQLLRTLVIIKYFDI